MNSIVTKLLPQFYERTGPLTSELLLAPGEFGLGKVPRKKFPDATTTMVCGYCSTGCGLNIHLKDGEATNLTPSTDYPVNLGMACSKGWEALSVLDSPHRATTPLLRNAKGKLEAGRLATARCKTFLRALQGRSRAARPRVIAFSAPVKSPPKRWCCWAVSPSLAWGCCMATATRGSAWPRRRSSPTSSRSASTLRRTPTPTLKSPTSSS